MNQMTTDAWFGNTDIVTHEDVVVRGFIKLMAVSIKSKTSKTAVIQCRNEWAQLVYLDVASHIMNGFLSVSAPPRYVSARGRA